MPIYEYICKECHHQFEALLYGKEKAECPKCHATKLEPQLSVFAVSAKSSSPSASPAGACGSCGDPRGPGACSMRDMIKSRQPQMNTHVGGFRSGNRLAEKWGGRGGAEPRL
jgi:putative FmdB family regulatory protein